MPYFMLKRGYGEGELRIGDSLELDQSIFPYCFAIHLKDEIITKFMDPLSGVVRPEVEDHDEKEGDEAHEDHGFIEDDNDTCKELREKYEKDNKTQREVNELTMEVDEEVSMLGDDESIPTP